MIRRDTGPWEGYVAEELFPSTVIPVCTPTLARRLQHLNDLRSTTLLVVPHLPGEWRCWFEAAGLRDLIRSSSEVVFESNAMAMQAVLDGVGVAIAQFPYVSDALSAGRLVAPFPITAQTGEAWLLQYRQFRQEEPALQVFRTWLLGEAERQREIEARFLNESVPG